MATVDGRARHRAILPGNRAAREARDQALSL
jgi:hypothetical protein